MEYRSGFVSVLGRPNVGKSTLINTLVGQKIAAVSPRPQTTRKRQLGILTTEQFQLIFVDTPGIHIPHHKLGEYMNHEAKETIGEADIVLFMVDVSVMPPHEEDRLLVGILQQIPDLPEVFFVMNKIDKVKTGEIKEHQNTYHALLPQATPVPISSLTRENLDELLSLITDKLPVGPSFYPEEQLTDLYEREIAADLIRAAALLHLRDEVPHCIAIRLDEYTERNEHGAFIAATLFVERDSQKGIVIGKGGMMIKQIGSTARNEIEMMSGRKIFLKLRVKVRKNWRNDDKYLKLFGFKSRRRV